MWAREYLDDDGFQVDRLPSWHVPRPPARPGRSAVTSARLALEEGRWISYESEDPVLMDWIRGRLKRSWKGFRNLKPAPIDEADMHRIDCAPGLETSHAGCLRVDLSIPGRMGHTERRCRQVFVRHDRSERSYIEAYRFARLMVQTFRLLWPEG